MANLVAQMPQRFDCGKGYCDLCRRNHPLDDIVYMCGCTHAFCSASIRGYVLGRVAEVDLTPTCPIASCKATLSDVEVTRMLSPEEKQRYDHASMTKAAALEPTPVDECTVFCDMCTASHPIEDMVYLSRCNHVYCSASLHSYILDRIDDHDLIPKCPNPNCEATISAVEVTTVLTAQERERYDDACVNKAAANDPTFFESVPEPPRTVYCHICMDDDPIDDMFYMSDCNHTYCRASIRQYVLDRINQQDLIPKCPHPDCNETISDRDFITLLTVEEQGKYYQEGVNKAVALEPTLHKCLTEGCHGVGALPLDDPHFVCPLCSAEHCVQCNTREWHDGLTCEQIRQQGLDNQLHAQQLRDMYGGQAVYQCGQCGHGPIEHFACGNVQTHHGEAVGNGRINNACPNCGWFAGDIAEWPRWDGELHIV